MKKKTKTIYLLIGPKGSGKSFIGSLFSKYFDIRFVRVEDRILKIKNRRSTFDPAYIAKAFEVAEKTVREATEGCDSLVFESTGLTVHFHKMLESLKKEFRVITVSVAADEELCLERVKTRESGAHINVSDKDTALINRLAAEQRLPCDFSIDNNGKTTDDLIVEIGRIVNAKPIIS